MASFLTPRQYFRLTGGRPRKRFGQNFLVHTGTAERIVECAGLDAAHVAVEIGPGLGALTRHILPRVRRLHLVELDRDLAAYLEKALEQGEAAPEADLGDEPGPVEGVEAVHAGPEAEAFGAMRAEVRIHVQDVMEFDFLELSRNEGAPLVLLGNLPYNISSPLMFHLLESRSALTRGVFMVQKEVGERFAAPPSTREYGVLSVLLSLYAKVTTLFAVGPGQFYPPPRVDSIVLKVDFLPRPPDTEALFPFVRQLVSAAFQKRRKTLLNALKDFVAGDRDLLSDALAAARIDPQRRPETLSPEEYLLLAGKLS